MARNRLHLAGGLLAILATVAACGSAGATASVRPSQATSGSLTSPISPGLSPSATVVTPATPSGEPSGEPSATPAAHGSSAARLPAGALTIAALGDSLTAGDCDDSGLGGYVGRLQTLIAASRPGTRIVNFGRSGWASTDLINGLNGEASQLTQAIDAHAKAALVWIGSNDLWYLYEYGPEPMTADAEQEDLRTYSANVDTILSRLTGHGVSVFIALLDDQSKRPVVAHPNTSEPAFPATTKADLARMAGHIKAYNDIIRARAATYGAATVDFSATKVFTTAATLCSDGNHPNAAGYAEIARVWMTAMEPRLK